MFEEGAEGGGSVGLMSLSPPLLWAFSFQHLVSCSPSSPACFGPHLPQPVQPELLPKVFLVSVLSVASPQAAVAVGKHHTPPAELLSRALDEVDKVVDKISC